MQAQALPLLLSGRDAVIAAETGSGKTLAYLAPIVSRMLAGRRRDGDGSAAPDELQGRCERLITALGSHSRVRLEL